LPICSAVFEKLLVGFTSHLGVSCVLDNLRPNFLFPIFWKTTVFAQVVVPINFPLVLDETRDNLHYIVFERPPNSTKTEGLLKDSLSNLVVRLIFVIQNMLVEEGILTILVSTVEEPIAVDNIVPETLWLVKMEVVRARLEVVLVTLCVELLFCCNSCSWS